MANVKPFKAVRPVKENIDTLSSKLFEVFSDENLNASQVKSRYQDFKTIGELTQEEIPAFYVYQKKTKTNNFCGIIASVATEDYHNDVIKIHESTLKQREILFENFLKSTRFTTEPVLLTYPDNQDIDGIIEKYQSTTPEYSFISNEEAHFLWIINNEKDIQTVVNEFHKVETLYIADGHHRTTSSCALGNNLAKASQNHTGKEPYNYFMTYLLSESQLSVYEFNRFIKDLNGLSSEEFLDKLKAHFTIENKGITPYKPTKKHQFSMYLNGEFYALSLREDSYKFTDILSKLDAEILYRTVLKPILGIEDIRNASKIKYSQNKSGSLELKTQVDNGNYQVAFGMKATTIEEIKNIVDAGLVMPPKTTYIEPKLTNTLTIYEF